MKTIAELALEYGVHRTTLNKAARRGVFPSYKSGSIVLIDDESEAFKHWLRGTQKGRPRKRHMVPVLLVQYARQIAMYRGYPDLVNGLQPLERLQEKYQHEIGEFKEALASKSWLHMLHETADVLYYAACIDEQAASHLYVDALRECMQLLHSHGVRVTEAQIEAAALAKYEYRASAPNNKDEALELRLIEAAVSR